MAGAIRDGMRQIRLVRTSCRLEPGACRRSRFEPNDLGGDISDGLPTLRQMLARPVPRWNTYATPIDGVFLCSSATPPGPANTPGALRPSNPGGGATLAVSD